MIQGERIEKLNDKRIQNGDYLLYWMQSSHRCHYNHALEYAILKANKLEKPLIVYFGLTGEFPEANRRHYYFMLQGLKEVEASLQKKDIPLIIGLDQPHEGAVKQSSNASLVVVDAGYLKIERQWREYAAHNMKCPLIQVETDVVVPVKTASFKEEYSAATIRRKINKVLDKFMVPLEANQLTKTFENPDFDLINLENISKVIKNLNIDESVKEVKNIRGGTSNALKTLDNFIKNKLHHYQDQRNDPNRDQLSNISPYLHFGQISPLYIALEISNTDSGSKDAYLEELIIRRELSMNFVYYNPHYDSLDCLPLWARNTLLDHTDDKRDPLYHLHELENAETGDIYWNACQKEMMITGKMHGYMRMYWGKKILEWTKSPQEAFKIALYLNNKYEIDGRDPNGYTGVAWCFGKHDRAWKERKVFGKVRYMNANGLKRKFNADAYVRKIEKLG